MNLEKKQLAIIIMVSTQSYSDLDQYRDLVQNYPSYEEFYRHYARCGNYFDADRSDIDLHSRCYEETEAVYWCVPAPGNGTPKWLTQVKAGYFSPRQNEITHKLTISDIRQWKDFSNEERTREKEHIVGSRRLRWENPAYGTSKELGRAMIWIKIVDIKTEYRSYDDFVKALADRGEPLKFVRSYSIVSTREL